MAYLISSFCPANSSFIRTCSAIHSSNLSSTPRTKSFAAAIAASQCGSWSRRVVSSLAVGLEQTYLEVEQYNNLLLMLMLLTTR